MKPRNRSSSGKTSTKSDALSAAYVERILQSMGDSLLVINHQGRITAANQAALTLLGYQRKELIGEHFRKILAEGLMDGGIDPLLREGKLSHQEGLIRTRSGVSIPVSLSASLLKGPNGRVEGGVFVAQDLTERKRREENEKALAVEAAAREAEKKRADELAKAYRDLEKAQTALIEAERFSAIGLLAQGMAHELNNPVGAIRSYLQHILEETPMNSPIRTILERAERATGRCRRIVSELLVFSREPDSSRPCDLNRLVRETLLTAKEDGDNPQIEFVFRLEPQLPQVPLDLHQIRQVLMNLISNAGDSIAGTGMVTVATRLENSSVFLDVSDTGSGIPWEVQKKIFEPFFTTKPPGMGIGLGLAMSHNLVRRHGGDIRFESVPGHGTRFTVRLPLKGAGESVLTEGRTPWKAAVQRD